jgi:hypothetical protein
VALEAVLQQPQGLGRDEAAKELARMRATAHELRSAQHELNLERSGWFSSLVARQKELGLAGEPERRLVAALRQVVLEGWTLTPRLFEQVILAALDEEDFKSPAVHKLVVIVLSALKMDLREHAAFLTANKLTVPKALLQAIEEQHQRRDSTKGLVGSMRAAALAVRWKRRSVQAARGSLSDTLPS